MASHSSSLSGPTCAAIEPKKTHSTTGVAVSAVTFILKYSAHAPLTYQSQCLRERAEPSLTWDGGAQCHEHHGGDGVFKANGAAKMWRQVPYDSRQEANDTHRDSKAGPAAPVVGGRHQREQDFPEDGHKVTRVVQARRRLLQTAIVPIVIVVVSWVGKKTTQEGELAAPVGVGSQLAKGGRGLLPELTVMASRNCSRQLLVPVTSARLVFFRILSTALCNRNYCHIRNHKINLLSVRG